MGLYCLLFYLINKIIYSEQGSTAVLAMDPRSSELWPDQALRFYLINYSLINFVVPIRDCVFASNTLTIYVPGIHPVASPVQVG